MQQINDAPYIRETERTGHCSSGFWNSPPLLDDAITCDRCGDKIYLGDGYYDFDGTNLCDECFYDLARQWRRQHGE